MKGYHGWRRSVERARRRGLHARSERERGFALGVMAGIADRLIYAELEGDEYDALFARIHWSSREVRFVAACEAAARGDADLHYCPPATPAVRLLREAFRRVFGMTVSLGNAECPVCEREIVNPPGLFAKLHGPYPEPGEPFEIACPECGEPLIIEQLQAKKIEPARWRALKG